MEIREKVIQDLNSKECEIYLPKSNMGFDILVYLKQLKFKRILCCSSEQTALNNNECDLFAFDKNGSIVYSIDIFKLENLRSNKLSHFDPNILVNGPYLNNENRFYVFYENKTLKSREMTLYSRYLMEQKLGRYLDENETVDHIDRNKNNDSIDNLQILDFSEHIKLDSKRVKPKEIQLVCVWCNKKFIRITAGELFSGKKAGPFCSSTCSGQYGAKVRYDKSSKLENKPKESIPIDQRDYYYLVK